MEEPKETQTPINAIITKNNDKNRSKNNNKTMMYSPSCSPSLKQKLKSSLTCFPSPFRHHHHRQLPFSTTSPSAPATPRLGRTSSINLSPDSYHSPHVTFHDHVKGGGGGAKCKTFISCIGGTGTGTSTGGFGGGGCAGGCGGTVGACVAGGGRHRRRTLSADFKYDALSYALNFDDGGDGGGVWEDDFAAVDDQFRFRSFSSRLPPSPTVASRENATGSTAAAADGPSLDVFVG